MAGGGAFNQGDVGDDVLSSLQGELVACGDWLTYLTLLEVQGATGDKQTVELSWDFRYEPTGQAGAGCSELRSELNTGIVANGDGGTGVDQNPNGFLVDGGVGIDGGIVNADGVSDVGYAELINYQDVGSDDARHKVEISNVEDGDKVVIRIDCHLVCQPYSTPTGALQAGLVDVITTFRGGNVVNEASSSGAQTIPFQQVGNILGLASPLLKIYPYVSPSGTCGTIDNLGDNILATIQSPYNVDANTPVKVPSCPIII